MAKPEQKEKESAMELAGIIAKLIVDVEELERKLNNLLKKQTVLVEQVMILGMGSTPDTRAKLVQAMFTHEDFIKFASDDVTSFDEVFQIMEDNSHLYGDDLDKDAMRGAFNEVKEMFSLARHELDLSKDKQEEE
jgi:hypothetical protein|tara:strand:+ start:3630 stop:4034 length:405 start_codon:yes stop_codon:yes gene_type:complete